MSTPSHRDLRILFFGTPQLAVTILNELKEANLFPALIVTQPDKPVGRKQVVTPPPVKVWAESEDIDVLQVSSLKDVDQLSRIYNSEWDLFIVAAYGLLIPKEMLALPRFGTLNVHPSLLPRLRGASPVRSAILRDERDAVGISIMLLDEELDHGPIVAQARIEPDPWPIDAPTLEALLATEGGKLLVEAIPLWVSGEIPPEEQEHSEATYCSKITKDMGEIDLAGDTKKNWRTILALEGWPGTFFFSTIRGKKTRVKIVEASLIDDELVITKVIPEGKKEMSFADWQRGNSN